MNNKRIRYQTVAPGILKSRRMFTTNQGQEVLVQLDLNLKQYQILDSVTGTVVASGGRTRNKSVLKIQSKRALMALGVEFADETRNRSNVETTSEVVGR